MAATDFLVDILVANGVFRTVTWLGRGCSADEDGLAGMADGDVSMTASFSESGSGSRLYHTKHGLEQLRDK